jgi:hypothetical protein
MEDHFCFILRRNRDSNTSGAALNGSFSANNGLPALKCHLDFFQLLDMREQGAGIFLILCGNT